MQQQFTAKTMAILTDQIKLDHTTRWIVKTVSKQNRVLFDAIETYRIINQHAVLVNSTNLVVNKSKHGIIATEFRFHVVRVWFAKSRIAIGTLPFITHSEQQRIHRVSLQLSTLQEKVLTNQ